MEQNQEPVSHSAPSSAWSTIKEWIQVIIVALIISLPIRFFIAEPFVVNGASMDPTFSTGQFLVVDRLTYRFEAPSRGDVIVFEYPNDPSIYYIKRIIGLPGETLDFKDGKVTVKNTEHPDGIVLTEPYIEPIHASHDTLHVQLSSSEYFVMGDNRAQSSDSRAWGPLDRHFIVGRPIVRLLPVSSMSVLPGKANE
jgi:signal peptidase I